MLTKIRVKGETTEEFKKRPGRDKYNGEVQAPIIQKADTDKIEQALSMVLKKEAERFDNPIICNISHDKCKQCQPLCTNRQKQESKLERIRILHEWKREIQSEIDELNKELDEEAVHEIHKGLMQ